MDLLVVDVEIEVGRLIACLPTDVVADTIPAACVLITGEATLIGLDVRFDFAGRRVAVPLGMVAYGAPADLRLSSGLAELDLVTGSELFDQERFVFTLPVMETWRSIASGVVVSVVASESLPGWDAGGESADSLGDVGVDDSGRAASIAGSGTATTPPSAAHAGTEGRAGVTARVGHGRGTGGAAES